MAEIVCHVCIFHLTWLMSLHYLVKGGCSKFLPNTGLVTISLLRFGVKVKTAYCRDNFLTRRPLPGMHRLSEDNFSWSEREMRETCRHLGACVHLRGAHFEHEFWQFWADLSWQLITLLNKPYSVYCVLVQLSDTLFHGPLYILDIQGSTLSRMMHSAHLPAIPILVLYYCR